MGDVDGHVAKLWRMEFEKHGIGYDETVLIGSNLGELDRPEFIPNVFQLIGIVKKIQDDPEYKIRHERVTNGLPLLMSEKEIQKLRVKTEKTRTSSIDKMNNILGFKR